MDINYSLLLKSFCYLNQVKISFMPFVATRFCLVAIIPTGWTCQDRRREAQPRTNGRGRCAVRHNVLVENILHNSSRRPLRDGMCYRKQGAVFSSIPTFRPWRGGGSCGNLYFLPPYCACDTVGAIFQVCPLMNFEASAGCVVAKSPRLNMEAASRRDAQFGRKWMYPSPACIS
jgi:hypothetical protein